jgi:late competence protein required for DNA uptake (superfamily II DNA/RNA helicase)
MSTVKCSCCATVVQLQEAEKVGGFYYCSFDCVAFEQDQQQEALDSYFVGEEDTSGEYVSLYK